MPRRSQVDRVRQYPGGRWLEIDTRELELTVPLGADIAPSLVQLGGSDAAVSQEAGRGLGLHAEGQRDARGDPGRSPASSCWDASRRRRSGRTSGRLGRTLSMMAGGLSILMPVFDERSTIEAAIDAALDRRAPGRATRARHRGRRLDRRDARAPARGREWPDERQGHLPRAKPRQGRRRGLPSSMRPRSSRRSSTPTSSTGRPTSRSSSIRSSAERRTWCPGTRAWTSQSSFSFWYVIGNKAVTTATNVLYNCWISDVMTCHKAMRTALFSSLPLRERGFAIEPEIAARLLRLGRAIHQVPIVIARARARPGRADGCRRAARPADARSLPRVLAPRARPREVPSPQFFPLLEPIETRETCSPPR